MRGVVEARIVASFPPQAQRRIGGFWQVWRPAIGDVLEGEVVDADARATTLTGFVEPALAVQPAEGSVVYVMLNAWLRLATELERVGPLDGDRVHLERVADGDDGRRHFHVERLEAAASGVESEPVEHDDFDDDFLVVKCE